MTAVAQLEAVNFRYRDGAPVFKDFTWSLREGQYCALLGENGSGKSTLVRLLLGLETPQAGRVRLWGTSIGNFTSWRRIGFVPQNPRVVGDFCATVSEIVVSGLVAKTGIWRKMTGADKARIAAVMEAVGVADLSDRRASRLSGGQLQRVFLARALASDPDLLVLDEPTASIDEGSREQFFDVVSRLHTDQQRTIVLISHGDIGQLSSINRVVRLAQGRIIEDYEIGLASDTLEAGEFDVTVQPPRQNVATSPFVILREPLQTPRHCEEPALGRRGNPGIRILRAERASQNDGGSHVRT